MLERNERGRDIITQQAVDRTVRDANLKQPDPRRGSQTWQNGIGRRKIEWSHARAMRHLEKQTTGLNDETLDPIVSGQ
ncbi:hypothetical protein R1flu_009685 [Riccia fluitans]|uniref:Uncharacterized protein n=1 Tax=Riccia fluitans TaxID=41844 RepID=A0ABD1Z2Y4_9MARC